MGDEKDPSRPYRVQTGVGGNEDIQKAVQHVGLVATRQPCVVMVALVCITIVFLAVIISLDGTGPVIDIIHAVEGR